MHWLAWNFRAAALLPMGLVLLDFVPGTVTSAHLEGRYQPRAANSTCRKTKVAILGAGLSGITTSQVLSNYSIDDFVIVEYQNRIGGRIWHDTFGSGTDGSPYTVEFGANWIEGVGGENLNPILVLEQKWNMSSVLQDDSLLTYTEAGQLDYTDEVDAAQSPQSMIAADAGQLLLDNKLDRSMRDSLSLAGWKPKQRANPQLAMAAEWYTWDFTTATTAEHSSTIFNVVNGNVTWIEYGSDDRLVIDQRGHDYYVKGEASTFLKPNDTRLLLNTVVDHVAYGADGVTVSNIDGSCIEADYAVVTFSLGVLQREGAVTFEPVLPEWKRSAIERFTSVKYTKIFYQFPTKFWPNETAYFLYADPARRGYYPAWQTLDLPGYLEGSRIIFVTVVGEEADRIDRLSEDDVKAEGLAVLRLMFPGIDVPDPIDFTYPRWDATPWAYASYTNWPVGFTLKEHSNLRANVDRLWFTGEYASTGMTAHMHGAYTEAQELGRRLVSLINGACPENGIRGQCGERVHYDDLHGTTPYSEYNVTNGWIVSSFSD